MRGKLEGARVAIIIVGDKAVIPSDSETSLLSINQSLPYQTIMTAAVFRCDIDSKVV